MPIRPQGSPKSCRQAVPISNGQSPHYGPALRDARERRQDDQGRTPTRAGTRHQPGSPSPRRPAGKVDPPPSQVDHLAGRERQNWGICVRPPAHLAQPSTARNRQLVTAWRRRAKIFVTLRAQTASRRPYFGEPAAAGRRRSRAASGAGACHHRPGRGSGGDRGSAECDRHPVGAPRRCAAPLLGRHHSRRPRHRDEGFDCRDTDGRRATRPRPARQRCPGGARRRGHPAAENAGVSALRAAVAQVIEDPRYRAAAGRMASRLAAERDENLVVDELEHMVVGARGR
jgi:hypothetical protein